MLLSVWLVFPEYSNTRTFVMRIEEEDIAVQCDELSHLADLTKMFLPSIERGPQGGMIRFLMQQGITKQLLNRTFTPYLSGKRIDDRT